MFIFQGGFQGCVMPLVQDVNGVDEDGLPLVYSVERRWANSSI